MSFPRECCCSIFSFPPPSFVLARLSSNPFSRAFELTARYSELGLGPRVFTAGLADPNLWTNRAEMTDVGFNWYLNKFVKVYFDWEHAMFAQPVYYRPGGLQKTSDLFWLRFQVYF